MKNIVAITIGISDALELGDNFRSTLIVKGLSEIANLGSALGCERSTFYGNAGLGDLIATSLSKYSRNRQFGYLLGKGHSREEAETKIGAVVEGIHALRGTFVLTSRARLSSPYFDVIYQIIQGRLSPEEVIKI